MPDTEEIEEAEAPEMVDGIAEIEPVDMKDSEDYEETATYESASEEEEEDEKVVHMKPDEVHENSLPPVQTGRPSGDRGTWSETPSVENQLQDHFELCRLGPSEAEIFNLLDPKDLEKYNKRLRELHPPGAPKRVKRLEDMFHNEGVCRITMITQRVEYRQLQ